MPVYPINICSWNAVKNDLDRKFTRQVTSVAPCHGAHDETHDLHTPRHQLLVEGSFLALQTYTLFRKHTHLRGTAVIWEEELLAHFV